MNPVMAETSHHTQKSRKIPSLSVKAFSWLKSAVFLAYTFVGVSAILAIIAPYSASAAITRTQQTVQPLNDFVVEPGKQEVLLTPGKSETRTISITSRIQGTQRFVLTTEDFKGSDDAKSPVVLLGDERGPYSLKDFIKPEVTSIDLAFGEKVTIPVTISIPEGSEPRGYYGALLVSNTKISSGVGAGEGEAQGSTQIISRVGILFLTRISGNVNQNGHLENFKLLGPSQLWYQRAPSGFEIQFKNTGNVHLVPNGKIAIKNIFGGQVDALPVDAYFSLPDSMRYREVPWKFDGILIGRYTATLDFYKGYGSDRETRTIAFWVLPWRIILPFFLIVFVIFFTTYYILTRFEFKRKSK